MLKAVEHGLIANWLICMRKIGYLRVSTCEQRPDRQIIGLEALCDELHVERLSATRRRRPVYEGVMASLRSGDALVVWDLDRAWRSLRDALNEIDRLQSRGIEIQVLGLQMDFGSPEGTFTYQVMGAAAELERRMLARRTREGLAAARSRGVRLGRPMKLNVDQLELARQRLTLPNATIASVAKQFGIAPWSLTRCLRRGQGAGP